MASAPAWLLWFTYYDMTAQVLDLPAPDLSTLKKNSFGPRPYLSNIPRYQRAHLNLLRQKRKLCSGLSEQATPRERRRAMRLYCESAPAS
jgi:hypothetical protein